MAPSSTTTSARQRKGRGQSRGPSAVKYRLMTCNERALSVCTKKYPRLMVFLMFLWALEMFNKTKADESKNIENYPKNVQNFLHVNIRDCDTHRGR